jgi:hypothetical protein
LAANDGPPDISDAVNRIVSTSFTTNADADPLFRERDSIWREYDGSITLIGLAERRFTSIMTVTTCMTIRGR